MKQAVLNPRAYGHRYQRHARDLASVTVTMPVRTSSELNCRGGWRYGWNRKRQQQGIVAVYMAQARGSLEKIGPPYTVTLTRIGKRALDPDNLAGSAKHVQDSVARSLGVDDGDVARVTWRYEQAKGDYAVRVRIEGRPK